MASFDTEMSSISCIEHILDPSFADGNSHANQVPLPETPPQSPTANTTVYPTPCGPLPPHSSPVMDKVDQSGNNANCVKVDFRLSSMDKIFGITAPRVVRYRHQRFALFRIMMPTPYGPEHMTVKVEGEVNLHLKASLFSCLLTFRLIQDQKRSSLLQSLSV